jgi:integrase
MIRRVYENQHGIITLDSDIFGIRKRISTGKKADKRNLAWYERNFESEYKKLYDEKFTIKPDLTDLTLREYGKMILELTSSNRKKNVQLHVERIFRLTCDFKILGKLFGDMNLSEIKPTHILLWQKDCGLASQTIASHRVYLNMVLQSAMNDDLIPKNPVALTKLPKRVPVRKKNFYNEDDIKTIIGLAKGQLKNYIQLACFTGLRGSELIALRWDDIDFEKGIIRVDTRIVDGEEDITKSGKTRFVPIFKQARDALSAQRMRSGLREFVFIAHHGGSLYDSDVMTRAFRRLLKKNGLDNGTIHDLRRSFNTLLKQYGYPTDWILDIMGHMDDKVNRNHYTGHLTVDMTKLDQIAL